MLAELDGYDWGEAFAYADRPMLIEGSLVSVSGFTRDDVAEIVGITEGENDGHNWEIAGRLTDGRWFFLSAGCDYTGWDCVASGQAWVADDRDSLIQFGLTAEARECWGLA